MRELVFECESVTPMFMYGADNKTPELRPASIKGVMRFWWRAINGDLPLDKLKKQEDEIFGSTEKRSSFSIRVNEDLKSKKEYPLPHKKKGDKGYHQKNAFITNQTFQVIFRGKNLELISNIFKLSTLLGGFGQRSRRGFGSIRVIKRDNNKELYSLEKIEGFIENIPKFPNLTNQHYPYIREIELGKSYNSFERLLETIGEASHLYDSDALGYARGKNRLASPIYVSVFKLGEKDFKPIITTLNNSSVTNFKKAIL